MQGVLRSAETSLFVLHTCRTDVQIAVGPLGRNAEGSGSLNTNGRLAAMYSYSKTKGLFGGVSVEGSVIVERQDANRLAYGGSVSSKQLLSGAIDSPEWAQPLIDQITRSTKLPGGQTWKRRDEEEDRGEFDRGPEQPGGYAFGEGVGAGGYSKPGNRKRSGSLASTFAKSSSPSPSPRPDGSSKRLSTLNPFSSGTATPRKQPKATSESYNTFGPEGDIDESHTTYGTSSRDSPFPSSFRPESAQSSAPRKLSTADLMIWDDVPPKPLPSGMTKSSTENDLLGSWASNGHGLTASFDKLATTDPWTPQEARKETQDEHLPRETRSSFATEDWQLPTSSRTARKLSNDDGPSRIRKERPFSSFYDSNTVLYGGDDKGSLSATRHRSGSGGGDRPFAAYEPSPSSATSPFKTSTPKIPLKAGLEGAEDGLPRAIGLFDFTADADGDLGFKAGQVVIVLNKVGDGKWWNGRNPVTGQVGIFPSSYVEVLERPKTAPGHDRHAFTRSRSHREQWD